ncbi:hypothetical protein D3H55_10730 [Bacillus salacetis]|uniref:Uncharacterized protein n=1 Tax=Bacillus salacetis TaxID=2315464 RepID=A0A3A1QXP6_9BACI|nr:hypothetical protein D3H55_10730 [Bacillus salacetis]
MKRERGKWLCPTCKITSKRAHLQALHEYFLLLGPTITNSKAREFLQITSLIVAGNLLAEMDLEMEGSKRGSVYQFKINKISPAK